MNQSSIARWATLPAAGLILLLCGTAALAQAPAQPYPNTPNYSPAPYQPSSGNSQVQAPQANQYPPRAEQPAGPATYPTIEPRQPAGNPPVYGPQPPVYGPDPRLQGQPQGQSGSSQPINQAMQGPASGPMTQPAAQQAPKAPFVLSPQEATVLDNVLNDWEKRNKEIHTLESKFFRWKYDGVFGNGNGNQPPAADAGELKFSAPDKGLFLLKGKKDEDSEQWLCDGKSIFQFDYKNSVVTEHVLPPELQGKAIADGPLPFVFCTEAQKLKQRYFMRIITPPTVPNEVWLEAYPRSQQQAAEFSKVEVILQFGGPTKGLLPYAIQLYDPNGKSRTVYQLQDPVVNPPGTWLSGLGHDWTKPSIPLFWKKRTNLPPQPVQAQGPRTAMGMQR